MANNYFKFKQFTVYQDNCAMKVGTDGVLLGAWVKLSGEKSILDAGTGTGVIALMMAQRCKAHVDAVEIDEMAAKQAQENIKQSPWSSRIKVFHTALQDFAPGKEYDLIISNPPYFSNNLRNPNEKKSKARHDVSLNMDEFLIASEKLLSRDGKLALIMPFEEGKSFIQKAPEKGIHCIRKTNVKPTPNKQTKRILMEFSRKKIPFTENSITIENNKRHDYTNDYISLTKDFYLHF
ncbi:MAG: tRNA1(Val) (adenine(37)-N6)-methyltransferase [Bacteroidales bacterium]